MSEFDRAMVEDCRLIILRELSMQVDYRLNEVLLAKALEIFGHRRSREFVRTQINKLGELGAVRSVSAGTVMVATITQAGLDHVERRTVIDGVARPSPDGI